MEQELGQRVAGLLPDEVFWMLLSFVALEAAEQLARLPGPVPERQDPRVLDAAQNPLLALSVALYDFFPAFCRSIASWDPWWLELDRALAAVDELERGHCLEELVDGAAWRALRMEARYALRDAGLDPHPIPTPLRLAELVARSR